MLPFSMDRIESHAQAPELLGKEREPVRRFEHNSRREFEREKIFLFFGDNSLKRLDPEK
jgi:hypothetical protein